MWMSYATQVVGEWLTRAIAFLREVTQGHTRVLLGSQRLHRRDIKQTQSGK